MSVRRGGRIPVLKKDFHVDPIQLLEARALGASAALLIARALSPDESARMIDVARELGLEVLVEVRDEDELRRALDARRRGRSASTIAISRRSSIDPATAERLLRLDSAVGHRDRRERRQRPTTTWSASRRAAPTRFSWDRPISAARGSGAAVRARWPAWRGSARGH